MESNQSLSRALKARLQVTLEWMFVGFGAAFGAVLGVKAMLFLEQNPLLLVFALGIALLGYTLWLVMTVVALLAELIFMVLFKAVEYVQDWIDSAATKFVERAQQKLDDKRRQNEAEQTRSFEGIPADASQKSETSWYPQEDTSEQSEKPWQASESPWPPVENPWLQPGKSWHETVQPVDDDDSEVSIFLEDQPEPDLDETTDSTPFKLEQIVWEIPESLNDQTSNIMEDELRSFETSDTHIDRNQVLVDAEELAQLRKDQALLGKILELLQPAAELLVAASSKD